MLIIGIICIKTGVSAQSYFFYSYALKALSGETVQGTLNKTTLDPQILVINEVYNNRDIKFKINNSSWQTVNNPNGKVLSIHGGMMQENIALSTGNKTLTMKTSNPYIGVTGISGSWWVSQDEYFLYH